MNALPVIPIVDLRDGGPRLGLRDASALFAQARAEPDVLDLRKKGERFSELATTGRS